MLRRIQRIICPTCGRARVTTIAGWHLCPKARPSPVPFCATIAVLLLPVVWAVWWFWPW